MTIPEIVQSWFQGTVDVCAALLVDVGIKGAVVLFLAVLGVGALRQSSAAVRHMVWCAAVVGLLALPLLSLIVPDWRVPVVPDVSVAAAEGAVAGSVVPEVAAVLVQDRSARVVSSGRAASRQPTGRGIAGAERAAMTRAVSMPRAAQPQPASDARATRSHSLSFLAEIGRGTWVFVIWLAGAAILCCWVAIGHLANWWLSRSSRQVTVGPLLDLVDELADELHIAVPVTLLEGRTNLMPRTWGIKPKLLLPMEASDWTDQRLRAVLLHELAHVRRRDYLTQLLAQFAQVIHWFNPLVWVAAHRMRVERERACDDEVLTRGSRASEYAEHLLSIASSMRAGAFACTASIAMARRSHLSDRLLDVLDATRRRTAVTPRLAATVWAAAALIVVPVAGAASGGDNGSAGIGSVRGERPVASAERGSARSPELAGTAAASEETGSAVFGLSSAEASSTIVTTDQQCDWYGRERGVSTSIQVDEDMMRVRIEMDDCELRIEADGEIEFNDLETDIASISRGGIFEIEEREGRYRRRLEVQPTSGAQLQYRWFIDGQEQSYDRAAQEWFTSLLPLVFRTTGFQAEERATRILEREGVTGLLQEISFVRSDYVARKYFEVVLTRTDLTERQLRDIVSQAGRELDSDYELAELLIHVAESHPVDETVQIAYVEAAGSIDSDYETRRVLNAVLDRPGLNQEVARAMLQLAIEIDSDYELAELLIGMLERHPIQDALTPEFFAAIEKLDSDYEHRRVLQAALERGAPDQEVLDLTLQSALRLDSDYEKSELLLQVADLYPTDQEIPTSYLDAAAAIDSDYERKSVISALVERGHLSNASLAQVLQLARAMDSDYELAELLVVVNRAYELDRSTYEPFFGALDRLDSDYERSRVLAAVLEGQAGSDEMLAAILGAASSIDSDYELSSLLVKIVESHPLNGELRARYVEIAESISSSYERDKALAALVRRGGIH